MTDDFKEEVVKSFIGSLRVRGYSGWFIGEEAALLIRTLEQLANVEQVPQS